MQDILCCTSFRMTILYGRLEGEGEGESKRTTTRFEVESSNDYCYFIFVLSNIFTKQKRKNDNIVINTCSL